MEVKQVDLKNLNSKELLQLKSLILEDKKRLLSLQANNFHYLGFIAYSNEKPVALLLATATRSYYVAELQSLFVEEKWREKNIASQLFIAFETFLVTNKCTTVTTVYEGKTAEQPIFEHILQKNCWMAPIPIAYRYTFDGTLFKPEWIAKPYTLPSSFTLFFWKDLKEEEKENLLRREAQGSVTEEISPFLSEETIEPLNSLGLKNEAGTIIGWMITHRINPTTISYSALYLEPEWRFLVNPVYLLIEAIKIQKGLIQNNHPAITALFDLNISQTTLRWQHFIEKRLKPHANKIVPILMSWKNLSYTIS